MSPLRLSTGQWAILTLFGLLLLASGALWGPALYRLLTDRTAVQAWVQDCGPWAPLASVLLNAAQVLLAPLPGQTVGVVNGYLYGTWLGTLYSLLGVELGTALALGLARGFGRPLVARLIGQAQLERWDAIAQRQGAAFFLLVFLLPFLPDDVLCFVAGMSPLSIPYLLLLAAVGRLPGLVVSSWVGANASELPLEGWVVLGIGAAALALFFWRYHARLEQAALAVVDKVAREQRSKMDSI